jgi:hypothetical protein
VRYIKFLLWQTMDQSVCHGVVALGCFLYGYQPGEIANLAPELFSEHHCRHIKRRLAHQLQARFQHAHIVRGEPQTLCTRPPTDHERRLAYHALALFAPRGCPHVPTPGPEPSHFETHVNGTADRSDSERLDALINPMYARLTQLIRDYNERSPAQSARRLAEPDHILAIPCFDP